MAGKTIPPDDRSKVEPFNPRFLPTSVPSMRISSPLRSVAKALAAEISICAACETVPESFWPVSRALAADIPTGVTDPPLPAGFSIAAVILGR